MKHLFNFVDVEEALDKVLSIPTLKPEVEEVNLTDAYGRVLAENIVSPEDIPLGHIAFFDGYALRSRDAESASPENPVLLRVAGKIDLKTVKPPSLNPKEAYYTPTGALLPVGADAVVPFETVETVGEEEIMLRGRVREWQFVTVAGKDIVKNSTVLRRGRTLLAQDLDLLFRLRIKTVKVARKPMVAIISVGSELTEDLEERYSSKMPASHGILIQKLVEAVGGKARYLGVCPDDLKEIRRRLWDALTHHDIAATIGGSSVGKEDLVIQAVNQMGKPGIIIHGLKIKPGAVSSLGLVQNKPVVLLPGLVQSTLMGFHFLLLPLILTKLGLHPADYRPTVKAYLTSQVGWEKQTDFKRAVFVKLSRDSRGFTAQPLHGESSLLSPVLGSNGYTIVPAEKTVLKAGEPVDVYLLPGLTRLEAV